MTTTKKKTTRPQRSAEERVAELEERIAKIKARQAAKEARATPHSKALIAAARALDKAVTATEEAGEAEAARALGSAQAILAEVLVGQGLRVPEPRQRRKGPRAA